MIEPGLLPLYTDLYQLTMAQAHVLAGRADTPAVFNYFFRNNPFDGGYVVFAGLGELLPMLESMHFGPEAIAWLRGQGFHESFLTWLGTWRFRGTVQAVHEGEIVFPLVPSIQVHGTVVDAQLIETLLLNRVNFESLIATKASRVVQAAGPERTVLDFGMRRAQGEGAMQASRAAAIGGVRATSNAYAAMRYGIPASGTMAHAWVQSFDDELTAFRTFVEVYGDGATLLVDTWNTLGSGVPNAIRVADEMKARGQRLHGIRLDSGDLAYLSKRARRMLDEAGHADVKIAVSNSLDEHLIKSLLEQGARIDVFGVGTRLVTASDDPALDGVYKLVASAGKPRMKVSDNVTKTTLPGVKDVFRYSDTSGAFYGDGLALAEEGRPQWIHHPVFPEKRFEAGAMEGESLLHTVMEQGRVVVPPEGVAAANARRCERLARLPEEHLRFANPHVYKVGISEKLLALRSEMNPKARR